MNQKLLTLIANLSLLGASALKSASADASPQDFVDYIHQSLDANPAAQESIELLQPASAYNTGFTAGFIASIIMMMRLTGRSSISNVEILSYIIAAQPHVSVLVSSNPMYR